MQSWGIDRQTLDTIATHPRPIKSLGTWVLPSDYPSGLQRKGAQGLVQFRLTVDVDGKPSACHIQKSTRPAEFDRAVCKAMMRRARFEPATDKDGNPVAYYWRNAVRFEMP